MRELYDKNKYINNLKHSKVIVTDLKQELLMDKQLLNADKNKTSLNNKNVKNKF